MRPLRKIAIINWKKPITVIMMENEDVADSLRKNFKMLWGQEAMVYRGMDGMRDAFDIMLEGMKKGDCHYGIGVHYITKEMNDMLIDFFRRRAAKGVSAKVLFNPEARKYGESRAKIPLTEVRYTPKGLTTPAILNVFGEKALITISSRKEPIVFVIDNKEVAQSFKSYFNMLWERKTGVYEGMDEVFELFYRMLDELKRGETYHAMGAGWRYITPVPGFLKAIHAFDAARIKKGVHLNILFNHDARESVKKRMGDFRKAEVKFTPPALKTPMQIIFYKDKALMVLWTKEPPTAFLIEDKAVAKSFRDYYNMLDKIARP